MAIDDDWYDGYMTENWLMLMLWPLAGLHTSERAIVPLDGHFSSLDLSQVYFMQAEKWNVDIEFWM